MPTEAELSAAQGGSTEEDKAKLALAKKNNEGFDDLILCLDHTSKIGRVVFRLVKTSKSDAFPQGCLPVAWTRLVTRFEPKNPTRLFKLEQTFHALILLDASQDPESWMAELEDIRGQIEDIDDTAKISDRALMIHVLASLPSEYDVIIDNLNEKLSSTGADALTTQFLQDKLAERYYKIRQDASDVKSLRNDKALMSLVRSLQEASLDDAALAAFVKQFKGTCNNCGQYGHKKVNCPELATSDESESPKLRKFKGKYFYCGKQGHMARNCRDKLSNEQAHEAIEEVTDDELVLMT